MRTLCNVGADKEQKVEAPVRESFARQELASLSSPERRLVAAKVIYLFEVGGQAAGRFGLW